MKTITPFELQMLIDERRVEVIDVRPRRDFEKVHVLVARSFPSKAFNRTPSLRIADSRRRPSISLGKEEPRPRSRPAALPRLG